MRPLFFPLVAAAVVAAFFAGWATAPGSPVPPASAEPSGQVQACSDLSPSSVRPDLAALGGEGALLAALDAALWMPTRGAFEAELYGLRVFPKSKRAAAARILAKLWLTDTIRRAKQVAGTAEDSISRGVMSAEARASIDLSLLIGSQSPKLREFEMWHGAGGREIAGRPLYPELVPYALGLLAEDPALRREALGAATALAAGARRKDYPSIAPAGN